MPFLSLPSLAQVDMIYDKGTSALVRQLKRLQTSASVLHIGAHPDDEDSALVAYHVRAENARTAYLSLTRGSGGQNIIGSEQSDSLGVIRTEELLQARNLDGAEQYFTRAKDFGFSKTNTEVMKFWPREEVLRDIVRIIREFRPDVIVSRWDGSMTDGHGHHQYSGIITPLAIEAAADPEIYPDQIEMGIQAWQVKKLYVDARYNLDTENQSILRINTGESDPIIGRSPYEIGMEGRSQHRTQQMGSPELKGEQISFLRRTHSSSFFPVEEKSIFDGIDTDISQLVNYEKKPTAKLKRLLEEFSEVNKRLIIDFNIFNPNKLIPDLFHSRDIAIDAMNNSKSDETIRLLNEKITEIEQAIIIASGVKIDALINKETLTAGSFAEIAIRVFTPNDHHIEVLSSEIISPKNWSILPTQIERLSNEMSLRAIDRADKSFTYQVSIPSDAKLTQPYWLTKKTESAIYDWGNAKNSETRSFDMPVLKSRVKLMIQDKIISLEREIKYREINKIRGDIRRRVDVVPKISIEPSTNLLVIPISKKSKSIDVQLSIRNNSDEKIDGKAQLSVPENWEVIPNEVNFSLNSNKKIDTYMFSAKVPDNVEAGEYNINAYSSIDNQEYEDTMIKIEYPHINTHRIYKKAKINIKIVDVNVEDVKTGYVMGSGDMIPESLQKLGLSISLLSDQDLLTGDLSVFDVIVIGIRASQTRPAFVDNNQRLLDFARNGGTIIVQYQQPDFAEKKLAPYEVTMTKNIRVVDETAPITILEPNHPIFNFPNKITNNDFKNWIQERNNYNFTDFDRKNFIPLTEAHDIGEPSSDGAMLYAKIGKGHYVYTSYSWFRQLPNGIPGAYRIFANMLSLPYAQEYFEGEEK